MLNRAGQAYNFGPKLSERWSCYRLGSGKVVWAEILP
jgi:hypothetical protein